MKKVVMYTGNPCPYCVYARALLDSKKIPYEEINVWEDETKREEIVMKLEEHLRYCDEAMQDHKTIGRRSKPLISNL